MTERAEWRRRAGGPTTALGIVLGADRWRGVPVWLVALGASVVWGMVAAFSGASLLILVPLTLGGIALQWKRPRRRIAPEPLPAGTFPTSIKLQRGWAIVGHDVGTVAFVDGWLVFEGEETSFSIAGRDVAECDSRSILLRDGTKILFTSTLTLGPESVAAFDGKRTQALEGWRAEPPAVGASRFPPQTVQASQLYRMAGFVQGVALYLCGFGVGGGIGALLGIGRTSDALGFLAILGVSAAAFAIASRRMTHEARQEERLSVEPPSEGEKIGRQA